MEDSREKGMINKQEDITHDKLLTAEDFRNIAKAISNQISMDMTAVIDLDDKMIVGEYNGKYPILEYEIYEAQSYILKTEIDDLKTLLNKVQFILKEKEDAEKND